MALDPAEISAKVDEGMKEIDKNLDRAGQEIMRSDSRARTALGYFVTILFMFGILLLVVSSYAAAQFSGGSSWSALLGTGASWVGIVAGVLCLLSSCFGLCATRYQSRLLLCLTLVFSFLFLFFQIAAVAVTVQYTYTLQVGSVPSGSLTALGDVATNNVLLSAYQQCCTGCPNGICNNPRPGSFTNGTLPWCAPPNACTIVSVCNSTSQTYCFQYTQAYLNQFSYTAGVLVPPVYVPPALCTTLQSTVSHGHHIVGYAAQGNCGGGNPSVFISQIAGYVESVLGAVAVVYVIVMVIQIFIVGLSMYIICRPVCAGKSGFEDEVAAHHLTGEDGGGAPDGAAAPNNEIVI